MQRIENWYKSHVYSVLGLVSTNFKFSIRRTVVLVSEYKNSEPHLACPPRRRPRWRPSTGSALRSRCSRCRSRGRCTRGSRARLAARSLLHPTLELQTKVRKDFTTMEKAPNQGLFLVESAYLLLGISPLRIYQDTCLLWSLSQHPHIYFTCLEGIGLE